MGRLESQFKHDYTFRATIMSMMEPWDVVNMTKSFTNASCLSDSEKRKYLGVHRYLFENSYLIDEMCKDGTEIRIVTSSANRIRNRHRTRDESSAAAPYGTEVIVVLLATKEDDTVSLTPSIMANTIGHDNPHAGVRSSLGWRAMEYTYANINVEVYYYMMKSTLKSAIPITHRMAEDIMNLGEDRYTGGADMVIIRRDSTRYLRIADTVSELHLGLMVAPEHQPTIAFGHRTMSLTDAVPVTTHAANDAVADNHEQPWSSTHWTYIPHYPAHSVTNHDQ